MTEIPDSRKDSSKDSKKDTSNAIRKDSLKGLAEKAAKAAQMAMSDKPPSPVELGGRVEKQPQPGTLISPPPIPAPPAGLPLPGLPGGLPKA